MTFRGCCPGLLIPGVFLVLLAPARGQDFAIDLEAQALKTTRTAHAEATGLETRPKARVALPAQAGKPIAVRWTVSNTSGKDAVKDVTLHFFVVKADRLNQSSVPRLDKDVPVEGALTMDFKPGDRTTGGLDCQIDAPGIYLLRLETIGAATGVDSRESFAALDLVVQSEGAHP